MATGALMTLPVAHHVLAPDGSEVRVLLATAAGSMAHFLLQPGQIARAIRHRTVEEIWYILSGSGEMWQATATENTVLTLTAGTCLTIPTGTSFQFRSTGNDPLTAVAITMPPWPNDQEAEFVNGPWRPTVPEHEAP